MKPNFSELLKSTEVKHGDRSSKIPNQLKSQAKAVKTQRLLSTIEKKQLSLLLKKFSEIPIQFRNHISQISLVALDQSESELLLQFASQLETKREPQSQKLTIEYFRQDDLIIVAMILENEETGNRIYEVSETLKGEI